MFQVKVTRILYYFMIPKKNKDAGRLQRMPICMFPADFAIGNVHVNNGYFCFFCFGLKKRKGCFFFCSQRNLMICVAPSDSTRGSASSESCKYFFLTFFYTKNPKAPISFLNFGLFSFLFLFGFFGWVCVTDFTRLTPE